MRGLILKDFINLKMQSKMIGILLVFYLILSIATKNNSMLSGMIQILFVMLTITALSYDEKANWDKYGLTMPVSRAEMVISKYILSFILSLLALILNFIAQILMGTEMNIENAIIVLTIFGVSIIFVSIILPILFKFGVEKGRTMMYVVLMLPTLIILLSNNFIKFTPSDEALEKVLYAFPLIIIVILILSILLSISIYKKKEF
jgi:ABC-type transport system involved in multi-copper enzyme maturation permease subunit